MTELLYRGGIDAKTGTYRYPPMTTGQIADLARARPGTLAPADHVDLEAWYDLVKYSRALRDGKDPKDLAQAGWGVIFAQTEEKTEDLKAALRQLLDRRKEQAGALNSRYYREFTGEDGYRWIEKNGRRRGETRREFLLRHGAHPADAADPEHVPYYLLIVGDPESIPYDFQYQLDVQYAVGRIWFKTLEEYERYACNVKETEERRERQASSRRISFWGTQHAGDWLTDLSATQLVEPLAQWVKDCGGGWDVDTSIGAKASKRRLAELFCGEGGPDLLFTASHGVVLDPGHSQLEDVQGALLCDNWPGPRSQDPLEGKHFFSAADLDGIERIHGLVTVQFACHSAGSPSSSDPEVPDADREKRVRTKVADHSFIARLPQRLLALGAQAFIGHVDSAWPWSIRWSGAAPRIEVFEDTLKRLLEGHPVGSAMELFGQRFASLSTELSGMLEDSWFNEPTDEDLADVWTARNDARNYVVVGDPAVRICHPVSEVT